MRSRLAGCLIGQCLGDALGYPVEGFPSPDCQDYLESKVKHWWDGSSDDGIFRFGQYTDDSQLARELLLSIVECGGFDPDDYAQKIARIFATGAIVGRGIACDQAASRLINGMPWQQAACPPPSAGNGTAMRAAPAGMVYHDRTERMIEVARQQGRITHRDTRCDAGSIAIAGGVTLTLNNRVEPAEFCGQLSEWIESVNGEFAGYIGDLPSQLDRSPDAAVIWASEVGLKPGFSRDWPGISPFVVASVLWSLWCFLRTPDDYFQSIWQSIACGGDVDSTAAMTGALSGAYVGLDALPEHLTARLHDNGEWQQEQLLKLVDRIPATATSNSE